MTSDDDQILQDALTQIAKGFRQLKGIGAVGADQSGDILFDEWDWEVGVGLYGDFRDAQARGNRVALDAIGRWYDHQIAKGLPPRQVNSTAPMLALACLAEDTGRAH